MESGGDTLPDVDYLDGLVEVERLLGTFQDGMLFDGRFRRLRWYDGSYRFMTVWRGAAWCTDKDGAWTKMWPEGLDGYGAGLQYQE